MTLYRASFKNQNKNRTEILTTETQTRHKKGSVGGQIATLKACGASCKSCKSFISPRNFSHEWCKLKDKPVRYYNLCEFHDWKDPLQARTP